MDKRARWAEEVARELYGLQAQAHPQAGERDDNFRLRSDGDRDYLLKISPPGEDARLLEFQWAVSQHLQGRTGETRIQAPHPTRAGGLIGRRHDSQGRVRLVRLMDFLPGRLMARARPHSGVLLESLGNALAQVGRALLDFSHPSMNRDLKWDLARPQWIAEHLGAIEDAPRRRLVEGHLQHFLDEVEPRLPGLRQSVIHGDANDYNILVSGSGFESRVSGLIDFGDALRTATVCDLAVAMAYAVLGKEHPVEAACRVTRGYHAVLPLTGEEVELLFPLMLTRLCVSVVNSALRRQSEADDGYLAISEAPAWEMLERLGGISLPLVHCRLRDACGWTAHPRQQAVCRWLEEQAVNMSPLLGDGWDAASATVVDLGVASPLVRSWSPRPQDWRIVLESSSDGAHRRGGGRAAASEGRAEVQQPVGVRPSRTDPPDSAGRRSCSSGASVSSASEALPAQDPAGGPARPLALAGYGETRPARPQDLPRQSYSGREWPAVRLGIEFFAPPGTRVAAPLPGRLQRAEEGGQDDLLALQHRTGAGDRFFSLYRGLHPAAGQHARLDAGSPLGRVGSSGRMEIQIWLDVAEAGGPLDPANGASRWLSLQDQTPRPQANPPSPEASQRPNEPAADDRASSGVEAGTFRTAPAQADQAYAARQALKLGNAFPSQRKVWMSVCPDPNLLVRVSGLKPIQQADSQELRSRRKASMGPNLSLAYRRPLHMVRGAGQYLYDARGRRYLDIYNNVPHVGHSHPRVVEAVHRQMGLLNTNTRYLNPSNVRYAERLAATFPDPLSVCYFTASGSEATELALRLARTHTGQRDLIVSDGAYHGHTTTLIDISPYKAEGPGGGGLPDWVHKAPLPDTFRGRIRGDRDDPAIGGRYAALLQPLIDGIRKRNRGLCGFMIESIPSCGGQIVLPRGYLQEAYRRVRQAGGVCIADEVQVGFGRLGSHMWGFQSQGVVPDIVALGKPIANGHPLAAVITRPEIAASFDRGMEFFSTFGGNTVSCAAGLEVLRIIEEESLQEHALRMGRRLQAGLRELQDDFPVIGDVRGMGLFQGVEIVDDPRERTPGPGQAAYLSNRLAQCGILTGTDGPRHNVLKLRGPLCFQDGDADFFLQTLRRLLAEDAAQPR